MAREKVEEVRGVKHRVKYMQENLYVSIFPMRAELFISSVAQDQDPLVGANLDAMSRMVTMAWKSNTLDKVLVQLKRSSRSSRDLPGILYRLLAEEFDGDEIGDDEEDSL